MRLNPSHPLVSIKAAKRLTHSLLYSYSSLCRLIFIITLSEV
ncbi:BgTH12-04762 [Blumeria graminis f. sp. triticale]|uniref:Bgt-51579 n=2 Tax=Blumeria graminis TaxID=34373 RepID=A0A9X9L7M0_BLUGR|nr:BgTH12-04762 [Blumeria graminis f. sp. triticale]VCU38875.1 Bgt-51579 [Blumeria graminis f. sp. tritici]